MPGATELENSHKGLYRNAEAGDFGKGDELRPEVGAFSWRVIRTCKWNVGEPAIVSASIRQESDVKHNPAEQVQVVAEGV